MGALNFTVFNDQRITLAAVLAKDSGTLECEVKVLVELTRWIAKKADLELNLG